MLTRLMKISTCKRTDSTPSADKFYLLSVPVQSQHMLGVNKSITRQQFVTNESNTWTEDQWTGPPCTSTSQKLPSPSWTVAEVRNWARHKLSYPSSASGTLLCVNTRPPRWQRKFLLALSKPHRYSARTANPVSFISTEFSLSERRSTKGRELRTH